MSYPLTNLHPPSCLSTRSSFGNRFGKGVNTATSKVSALFFQKIDNLPNKVHQIPDILLEPMRTICFLAKGKQNSIQVEGRNVTFLPRELPSKGKIIISIITLPIASVLGAITKPFSLIDSKYRNQLKVVLRALKKTKSISTNALFNRPFEFSEKDQMMSVSTDVHFYLMNSFTKEQRSVLANVSRYWNWVQKSCSTAVKEYRTKCPSTILSQISPRRCVILPRLLVPAHRAGISESTKKPLIQSQGEAVIPTNLIDMITPKMMTHPIMRLIDPWGRMVFAIRYQYSFPDDKAPSGYLSNIAVLVLHAVHDKEGSSWVGAQTELSSIRHHLQPGIHHEFHTPMIQKFFPEGWNKEGNQRFSHATDYLSRLLAGKPCGLCKIDLNFENNKMTVTETPPTFSVYGEEIPFVQIIKD